MIMRRAVALLTMSAAALTACGESAIDVTVDIVGSSQANLDPFAPAVGLAVVQVYLEGEQAGTQAIVSIDPQSRTATFRGYPVDDGGVPLSVRVEGLDEQGNIVAFGRGLSAPSDSNVSIQVPLRRNFAYVTHRRNEGQQQPESYIYVLDMATRALVEKIRLPGIQPRADRITARGGDALLVTYRDGAQGYLGILSAEDHSWRQVALPVSQRVALGVEGASIGVVAGGGIVTFVDLDTAQVVGRFPEEGARLIGGFVRDGVIAGNGQSALFILGGAATGSVIFVDVTRQIVEPLDVVNDPAGVSLAPNGRIAYVNSGVDPSVAEVDLRNGRVARANGFARPVGMAAYSENMEAVLALDASDGSRRVLALLPRANCPEDVSQLCGEALPVSDATPTTELPVDLAADGVGRQILVIGVGSSTAAAGLTLIETFGVRGQIPIGARSLYPGDPDDTFSVGGNTLGRQRYQPQSVAIIYGR
ncbi:MAG: hypothetical protein AAFN74_12560 [Myxococcota bacterium]